MKKTILLISLCFMSLAIFSACSKQESQGESGATSKTNTKTTTENVTKKEPDTTTKPTEVKISSDDFIKIIEVGIKGDVGANEVINSVTLEEKALIISVNISSADTTLLTLELLAESRTSSITDTILELTEYYSFWDTITVDFGSVGLIKNSKTSIVNDGYGPYFNPAKFKLVR